MVSDYYSPIEINKETIESYYEAPPLPFDIIPDDFYNSAILRLKNRFPLLYLLMKSYEVTFYWCKFVKSISSISFYGSDLQSNNEASHCIFCLNSEFKNEISDLSNDKKELLIYLILIHSGMQIYLKKHFSNRDINSEIISLLKIAEAYHDLSENEKNSLKQIYPFSSKTQNHLKDLLDVLDSFTLDSLYLSSTIEKIKNYLLVDSTLKDIQYDEIIVKKILFNMGKSNRNLIEDFPPFIRRLLLVSTFLLGFNILLFFVGELNVNFQFGTFFSLMEISLLSVSFTTVAITSYYVIYYSQIFVTSTQCPWDGVISIDTQKQIGSPGDDKFCKTIRCPLLGQDIEICEIRKKKKHN